jgi:hypothetical protein
VRTKDDSKQAIKRENNAMKLRFLVLTAAAAIASIAATPNTQHVNNAYAPATAATNLPDLTIVAERAVQNDVTCALSTASQYGDIPDMIVVGEHSGSVLEPVVNQTQGGDIPDIVVTARKAGAGNVAALEGTSETRM